MSDDQVSIGLLLSDLSMDRWAFEAVELARQTANVSIDLLVLKDDYDSSTSTGQLGHYAAAVDEYGAWAPMLGLHRLVNPPSYLQSVPIEDRPWAETATVLRAQPEPADGFGQRLPAETVDRIADADVDLLFRRGFGILVGDVLTTPTHGVVSYHHGDIRKYRGRPPGVWEFANEEETAGITLQRLSSTLDGGEIVVEKTVDITDCHTWQAVKQRLFESSVDMLATACRRLPDPTFEPLVVDDLGPLYSEPDVIDTARIGVKNAKGRVLKQLPR